MAHEVNEGNEKDERNKRWVGHSAEQASIADLIEALEHQVVGNRLLSGVDVNAATDDEEAAERHDQRIDADICREVSIDDSDYERQQQRAGDTQLHRAGDVHHDHQRYGDCADQRADGYVDLAGDHHDTNPDARDHR